MITRGSCSSAVSTAASRPPGSATLRIPTLEPSRDGLTQTGMPSPSARSRQPSSPAWQKSTCAIPRSRSRRLKISLSIVTAAASTPGPT
jgi:hypothetical protein